MLMVPPLMVIPWLLASCTTGNVLPSSRLVFAETKVIVLSAVPSIQVEDSPTFLITSPASF